MVSEQGNREPIQVLDQGYVALVETWGSDERIIEAARMSTDKGFLGWGHPGPWKCKNCGYTIGAEMVDSLANGATHTDANGNEGQANNGIAYCPVLSCRDMTLIKQPDLVGDEKLLRYLWTHHHTTPFEMGGLTIEVQAPIFVFREWHRHRTQSYNELSARYTPLPDMFYLPSLERLMSAKQSGKNKQSSEAGFSAEEALDVQNQLRFYYKEVRAEYEDLLNQGVAREIARLVIPVSQYSRMRASANLWNWLHFLNLRMDKAAQWEIRQYANVVGTLVEKKFPRTWGLFVEHWENTK